MATIQEIAKRAGTSVATVSHVINRTRFVSDELRGRVERAMEELGAPKQERGKITVGFLLRNYRCSFAEDLIDALHCCGDIHSREELSHRVVGPGDIEVVSILVRRDDPAGAENLSEALWVGRHHTGLHGAAGADPLFTRQWRHPSSS